MFKLNIQLFNNTAIKDLSHKTTYDTEKYIVVPGINGIEYRVNKDIFDKVPKGLIESKEEAYREAIVMMSYYLTYGEQAPSSKEIKKYVETHLKDASVLVQVKNKTENLKLYGGAINPKEDGYEKYIFKTLKNMLDTHTVLDHNTGEPVVKAGPFKGYAPKNAYAKVGIDGAGNDVYQLDDDTFITVKSGMKKNRDKTIKTLGEGDSFKFDKDQNFYEITASGAVRRDDGSDFPRREDEGSVNFDNLLDDYYNDVYSMQEGTLGQRVVDNKAKLLEQQARNQQIIAETNLQNQALQQAQTVKQITDSLKSERLAKLRAGMNPTQLADQDMQILLSNVQALNQQVMDTNQMRMESMLNQNTAYESAMAEYLGNADTIGQVATGMTAAGASNAVLQTEQAMNTLYGANWRNLPNANALYNEQYNITTTGNPRGNVTPEK
jgi:hypothetical protein